MILSTLFERRDRTGTTDPRNPAYWLQRLVGGGQSTAGENVNPDTAMTASSVFACGRNLAEDTAKLPMKVFEKLEERGTKRLPQHPLHRLLNWESNSETSAFNFRQAVMAGAVFWGNGYAEIEETNGGGVFAFNQIHPRRVTPKRDERGLYYEVAQPNGAKAKDVPAAKMLHISGFSQDGVVGEMISKLGKESIGLTMAVEKLGASFFGNGAFAGVIIKHPGDLSPEAQKKMKKNWDDQHRGSAKFAGTTVLDEGMTVDKMTVDNEQAQFLETRQFQVEEVARWFRMPPHKIGHLARATGWTTLETTNADYIIDALMPWMERIEQEIKRKCISRSEPTIYVKHNVAGLLRGDTTARFDAYGKAIQAGWMSRNDVRELEDLNPIDDGDVYLVPTNLMAAGAIETKPASERPQPTPPAGPAPVLPKEDDADPMAQARAMLPAHGDLLAAAIASLLMVEQDKITRAMKKPDGAKLVADFFAGHVEFVRAKIGAPIDAIAASLWPVLVGGQITDEAQAALVDETKVIAGEHIVRSNMRRAFEADRPKLDGFRYVRRIADFVASYRK